MSNNNMLVSFSENLRNSRIEAKVLAGRDCRKSVQPDSRYRGPRPTAGEVWECSVTGESQPHNPRRGALIVRPISKPEVVLVDDGPVVPGTGIAKKKAIYAGWAEYSLSEWSDEARPARDHNNGSYKAAQEEWNSVKNSGDVSEIVRRCGQIESTGSINDWNQVTVCFQDGTELQLPVKRVTAQMELVPTWGSVETVTLDSFRGIVYSTLVWPEIGPEKVSICYSRSAGTLDEEMEKIVSKNSWPALPDAHRECVKALLMENVPEAEEFVEPHLRELRALIGKFDAFLGEVTVTTHSRHETIGGGSPYHSVDPTRWECVGGMSSRPIRTGRILSSLWFAAYNDGKEFKATVPKAETHVDSLQQLMEGWRVEIARLAGKLDEIVVTAWAPAEWREEVRELIEDIQEDAKMYAEDPLGKRRFEQFRGNHPFMVGTISPDPLAAGDSDGDEE